jgi:hypothetical protein
MKREPSVTEAQATALIQRHLQYPDGTPIDANTASHHAWNFQHHSDCELRRTCCPPKPRVRPIKPTAQRLHDWIRIETLFTLRTTDATAICKRANST